MAGFDEAALQRLAALTAQAKAGAKLNAAAALELKELKLQKSAAALAKSRAQLAVARRKIEDREKYRLGGLASRRQTQWLVRGRAARRFRHAGGDERERAGGAGRTRPAAGAGCTEPAGAAAARLLCRSPRRGDHHRAEESAASNGTARPGTAPVIRPIFAPRRNSPAAWSSLSEPALRHGQAAMAKA